MTFCFDLDMTHDQASNYCIVLVTVPSREVADEIATALVQERLAACVSLMPVTSVYTWDNQLHKDDEWQLIAKTKCDRIQDLEARVLAFHPYDVPEVIAVPLVAGATPYLSWVSDQVSASSCV